MEIFLRPAGPVHDPVSHPQTGPDTVAAGVQATNADDHRIGSDSRSCMPL